MINRIALCDIALDSLSIDVYKPYENDPIRMSWRDAYDTVIRYLLSGERLASLDKTTMFNWRILKRCAEMWKE